MYRRKGSRCTGFSTMYASILMYIGNSPRRDAHQYSDQLPLIEKKWSDLSEDLKAQLVSSLVGNLKFNKIPVPREQLIRKRLKVGPIFFVHVCTGTASFNYLSFNDRTTMLRGETLSLLKVMRRKRRKGGWHSSEVD